jgi:cytochrome P450
MGEAMADGEQAGVDPIRELPRSGLGLLLKQLLSFEGGRVDMYSGLERLSRRHGNAVMLALGPLRQVYLFGPDANRTVLMDRDQIFSAKRPWDLIMGRIFPNGLLLRDGADHKHHRKILHEAFKRPALRDYGERMNPVIAERTERWARAGEPVLAFRAFKELTLDLAARVFVGVDLGPETSRLNAVFEDLVAASMSRIRLRIPGLEFYRGLVGREFLIRTFRDLLPKKRSADGSDMLSRLCRAETEEGERFRDQEIVDHMIFLMMAAHDTTTSTLSSMTYELARHPEWQERLRDESRALGRDFVGFDDLDALPALDWVMKETLRRYPPLPVIPRIATAEFRFEGYRVPKDAMVVVAPIHSHYLPEWWTAPTRFDPERFSPGRAEHERHTHLWIPFGGGPHHCIGFRFAEIQVRAILHQLLLRARWSVPGGYRMPVQQAPISKPRDGLPLRFAPL